VVADSGWPATGGGDGRRVGGAWCGDWCGRTSGCSGARAHIGSWFIQRRCARPLNLGVGRPRGRSSEQQVVGVGPVDSTNDVGDAGRWREAVVRDADAIGVVVGVCGRCGEAAGVSGDVGRRW